MSLSSFPARRISFLLPYSQRYAWEAPQNAVSRALAAARAARRSIIDLSCSNPTQASISLPDPFALASFRSSNYVPTAEGLASTREAIAGYYEENQRASINANQILLTASTSEAYSYCFKLVADPGDSILIPQPSYPLLHHLLAAEGLEARPYLSHEVAGQWMLDREHLVKACDQRTRAIVLVQPNNPTGHFLPADDLAWLIHFAGERLWLISDEVFSDYNWISRNPGSLADLGLQNLLVLSGLSKICALPQMKLGWIVAPPAGPASERLKFVSDTYLSVSAPIQQAAAAWLGHRHSFQAPVRSRCLDSLHILRSGLAASPWSLLPVEAGWAAILRGPACLEEQQLVLDLIEQGFSVHPGFFYDLPFPASLVVSLLTPAPALQAGIEAIIASGK